VLAKVAVVILLLASRGIADDRAAKQIDCPQLLTWIAAGIPNQRLARLVRDRGVTFQLVQNTAEILVGVGVGADLVKEIGTNYTSSAGKRGLGCPTELVQAAELVHRQSYDKAEMIVRKLLTTAPENADLHLVLGYLRAQQGDLDEAFDAYSDAKDLEPDFPEIHNGLSYVFYCSNDAENAVAEARTALSIDPGNAEGYRYLGLGLYGDENYKPALHALLESLDRDPNRAETYYDLGLVQTAERDLAAAVESYQKALRINPKLLDARTKLNLALRELGSAHAAVAEKGKVRPKDTPQ